MESQNNKIESILPSKWKMQILEKEDIEGEDRFPNVQIRILVNIRSRDEFKEWLADFENKTSSSYVISHTDIKGGKMLLLKQRLQCHHHTGCKRIYNPSVKGKTRNTNCPARMTVKIHNVQKKYRGKNEEKFALLKEMPCEIIIVVTHNHPTGTADILRFRKVSHSVKEQLMELFRKGHTPKTALDIIRVNIQLHSEDSKTALADRSQCPDYGYCHSLYNKEFKLKYGHLTDETKNISFLDKKIAQYNADQKSECAKIVFIGEESKNYVIGIATPVIKRVNTHIEGCSQIVIVDSSGKLDKDGRRVILLLTHSECGALPIGLIIATEDVDAVTIGFNILKELLGESLFSGYLEGPKVFMTNESSSEQNAIGNLWPKSKCLLSTFHVLQAVFIWLGKFKNCIPKDQITVLFNNFKNILYAKTLQEMSEKFEIALQNASRFENYTEYLANYWWKMRELWAMAYRDDWLMKNRHSNNLLENSIRELKDNIVGRIKTFNIVQVVDFMLTKYEEYNEKKLLDAANNRLRKNPVCKLSQMPSNEVLSRIEKKSDGMVSVPSEAKGTLINLVNMELLTCTCQDGLTGYICRHIDWANMLYYSERFSSKIDNVKLRQTFFYVATGQKGLVVGLVPLKRKRDDNETPLNSAVAPKNPETDFILLPVSTQDPLKNNANLKEKKLALSSNEEYTKQFNITFSRISQIFQDYSLQSPQEMADSVQKMLENMNKIRNPSDFASAMATFGRDNVGTE